MRDLFDVVSNMAVKKVLLSTYQTVILSTCLYTVWRRPCSLFL